MAIKIRSLGAVACAAILLAAAGCSGPSEAEGAAAGGSETKARPARASESAGGSGRSDMPPADYVRYRCAECSCAVFTGDGADCNRPGCRHHWSTHVRSFK